MCGGTVSSSVRTDLIDRMR